MRAEPAALGELLGKTGWFASAAARAERERAAGVGSRALADSVTRIGR